MKKSFGDFSFIILVFTLAVLMKDTNHMTSMNHSKLKLFFSYFKTDNLALWPPIRVFHMHLESGGGGGGGQQ